RNWPSDWQPDYIQSGAMDYPFQLPEARAVADFLKGHPNIAGVQSYHNNGGMILRGPGAESVGEYPMTDVRFYDELGQNGERILPFYRYIVLWSGLYTVHGGFIDYTNDGLGIPSFSNELWNGDQYFTSPALKEQQADPSSPIAPAVSRNYFDKYLEFGDEFVEWKPYDHPQFGKVEMGGVWKKYQGRVPPRFMNEELCHRNMAFSLYQAGQMPLIRMGETSVEKVGGDVYRVFVDITNPKAVPTIMARAVQNFTVRPDLLLLDGRSVEVIAASFIDNRTVYKANPSVLPLIDQKDLKRIIVRNGHAGKTTRTAVLLVKGSGAMTVTYDSVKGGRASQTVTLR
ncbi:MAG: M14 family zinc carboxypeptidase, partial [Candidatus Aminicenantales bacterium]